MTNPFSRAFAPTVVGVVRPKAIRGAIPIRTRAQQATVRPPLPSPWLPPIVTQKELDAQVSRLPSHVHEELKTQGVRPVAIGAKTTLLERLKGPFSGLHFPAIDAIPGSIQIRHDVGLGIRGESSKGVLEHEVGHALDVNSEALAIANLNSHSSRFRSICVKYNAGTKGGGGGMGGTTDEYYKYKWEDWIIGACTELYAQLYSEFMNDPVGLRFRDPQAFQFFNEVDGVLRHAHEPPGPPLPERPGPFSGPNPQITRPVPKINPVTVGIWGDGI